MKATLKQIRLELETGSQSFRGNDPMWLARARRLVDKALEEARK